MTLFNKNKLLLISGPCVIENYELLQRVCGTLKEITEKLNIDLIFKSSFDKANRSTKDSFRGPGLIKGLEMLAKIKTEFNVPILSDIHTPQMIPEAADVLDVLQIPAFLARQTDLYTEAAKTNCAINIKKGQFMAPQEMKNAIKKFGAISTQEIFVTERGTFFGYGNLVVDFRSIQIIKDMGVPYIYDATHSLQLPAAEGTHTGGQREFLPNLAKGQIAAGADGLFIESHPNVHQALSDKHTQYPLNELPLLLKKLVDIYTLTKGQ